MSEFNKGDEVWVKGLIEIPTPDSIDGDIVVAFPACGHSASKRAAMDSGAFVHSSAVSTDSPTPALLEREQAVIQAAKKWAAQWDFQANNAVRFGERITETADDLKAAVDALIEEEKPKTVEEILYDVWPNATATSPEARRHIVGAVTNSLRSNPAAIRQLLKEAEEGK